MTHGQTELTVSTIGIIAAIATCATAGKKAKHILRRIDYPTLIFFIGLFVVVGGLEETGILELIAKRLKVDIDKFPMNLDRYGNTSSASIPILLDELNRNHLLERGDKIILSGFGGGLTWGAMLIEW